MAAYVQHRIGENGEAAGSGLLDTVDMTDVSTNTKRGSPCATHTGLTAVAVGGVDSTT